MRCRDIGQFLERINLFENLLREIGMFANLDKLLVGRLTRLVENHVRHAQLADVVQQRRPSNVAKQLRRAVELLGNTRGDLSDACRVLERPRALGVDHARESFRNAIQAFFIGQQDRVFGFPPTQAVDQIFLL